LTVPGIQRRLEAVEPLTATPTNGAAPTTAPCPLENLSPETHQYIHALEQRITILEAEQKRFTDALKNAGNFLFNSPHGKMIAIAFPKEMQERLREFFHAS
jgi:hypothetical protein